MSSLLQPSQPQLPQPDAHLPSSDSAQPQSSDDDTGPALTPQEVTTIDAEVDAYMAEEMMTVAETKCRWSIVPVDDSSGVPVGLGGQIFTLNDMALGINYNGQRLAARCRMTKLHLKYVLRGNISRGVTQFVRIIVFMDKQNRIDQLFDLSVNQNGLLDNFFEPVARGYRALLAHRNYLGIDYTHFFYDRVHRLSSFSGDTDEDGIYGTIDIDLHRWTTTFEAADVAGAGVNVTNSLKVAFQGDVMLGNNPPNIQFTAAVEYTDA